MERPVAPAMMRTSGARTAVRMFGSTLTQGSAILGQINAFAPFLTAAYPLDNLLPTQLTDGVPSMSRISVPLPSQAYSFSDDVLPTNKNHDQRTFLLRVWKPSRGFKVTDITLELVVGSSRQQILVKQPRTGDGPTTSGLFHQVNATTLPAGCAWAAKWITEIQQRVDANPMLRGELEFYVVQVTFSDNTYLTNLPYGKLGPDLDFTLPPGGEISYDFQVFGQTSPASSTKLHSPSYASSRSVKTIGLWSTAQLFQKSWFGDWNNDKWCDYATTQWLVANQPLVGPVNDISLEHGLKTADHRTHLDGTMLDMFHPGYRYYANVDKPGSGTVFRDSHIFSDLHAARNGDEVASARLTNWIIAARKNLESIFELLPVGTEHRQRAAIYMATDWSLVVRNPTDDKEIALRKRINDGHQIYLLLLYGHSDSFQLVDSSGEPVLDSNGNAYAGAALDLGLEATDKVKFQSRFANMPDDSHTHHLHLFIGK